MDASGRVVEAISHDAFGQRTDASAAAQSHRFAGEYWDEDAQLVYLRARWYDPKLGRFVSGDPVEGRQGDPRSLNRYSYAHSDPVHKLDPSGLFGLSDVSSVLGAMGNALRTALPTFARFADKAKGIQNFTNFLAGRAPMPNTLPWGFWKDLPKVIHAGREYATIYGRRYTQHAIERMTPRALGTTAGGVSGRGIPPMIVEEVIRFGTVASREVVDWTIRRVYVLGDIRVVAEGIFGASTIVSILTITN